MVCREHLSNSYNTRNRTTTPLILLLTVMMMSYLAGVHPVPKCLEVVHELVRVVLAVL
jgi:hypothetical protein